MSGRDINEIICSKQSILLLRSLLIRYSPQKAINKIKEEKAFEGLLQTIEMTLAYDPDFFLLQDYLSKTQNMIRLGSDKFSTTSDLRQRENENIVALNKLSMTKNQDEIIDLYLGGEYEMREYVPYTDQLLYSSMANDYSIAISLQKSLNDTKKIVNMDPMQFLASTSYFTYILPELYESDPTYVKMSKEFIKESVHEKPELKKYAKHVKKRLDLFK